MRSLYVTIGVLALATGWAATHNLLIMTLGFGFMAFCALGYWLLIENEDAKKR